MTDQPAVPVRAPGEVGMAESGIETLDPRRWIGLGVVLFASFMGAVDTFIVNVSAPSIQASLHASFGQIQLVIASYTLTYGVGLVSGGRLGDLLGRKAMFQLGTALFTLTSLACALAPSPGALIGFRLLQGFGAAAMLPQVISIIQVTFPGRERPRAFSIFGAVSGSSAIAGQIIGGLLLRANVFGLGWRAVFMVNIPIGALSLVLSAKVLVETKVPRDQTRRVRLDVIGVLLLGPAVFFIIFPLARESSDGWSIWSSLQIVLSLLLLCAFFAYEHHAEKQEFALVPLRMFSEPAFTKGLALRAAFSGGATAMFLCLSFYLQDGMNLSPLSSGLMFVALGVGYVTSAILTRRILAHWWGRIVVFGAVLQVASFIGLLSVVTHSGGRELVVLDVCLWLFGTAQGLISTASNPITLHGLRAQDAGAASGTLLTMQTVANSIGVATIGTVFISVVHAYGKRSFSGLSQLHHYGHAYEVALFILMALTVPIFLLGSRLPRSYRQAESESSERQLVAAVLD